MITSYENENIGDKIATLIRAYFIGSRTFICCCVPIIPRRPPHTNKEIMCIKEDARAQLRVF